MRSCVARSFFQCQPDPGMLNIDTWFLAAPQPHNFLIDQWLAASLEAIAELPDWSSPTNDDTNARFVYHLVHCIFNQLYADDPQVHEAYERVPKHAYCEQHGYNAVEWCAVEYARIHPDFDVGPLGGQGYPTEQPDNAPDGAKFMYKGWSALDWMDFDAYDAHIDNVVAGFSG